MARSRDNDFLLDCRFHLLDVSIPSSPLVPFVFNPSTGFSSITAPEATLDKLQITPGNAPYPHKVIKRGALNTITLSRGATLIDSDFWRWYVAALMGAPGGLPSNPLEAAQQVVGGAQSGKRRNLLLVHFQRFPTTTQVQRAINSLNNNGGQLGQAYAASAPGQIASAGSAAYQLLATPSRSWVLFDCQPAGYKVATDFSATSNAVGLRSLSIDFSDLDEVDVSL